jgi:hypothetical protein
MILGVPCMELEHERAVYDQPIVEMIVVRRHELAGASSAEKGRVKARTRAHIADR